MKELYYVIQTLIHGRGANLIKVISLTLGLTVSILIFTRAKPSSLIMILAMRIPNVWLQCRLNGIITERRTPAL